MFSVDRNRQDQDAPTLSAASASTSGAKSAMSSTASTTAASSSSSTKVSSSSLSSKDQSQSQPQPQLETQNSTNKTPMKKKTGGKRVTRNTSIVLNDWYDVCHTYRTQIKGKISKANFLRSNNCSSMFTGSRSQQTSFCRYLDQYDKGELIPMFTKRHRNRKRKYISIEEKLVEYLNMRASRHDEGKYCTPWNLIREKCMKWAEEMDIRDFKCSDGWIGSTLKLHGFTSGIVDEINLAEMEAHIVEQGEKDVQVQGRHNGQRNRTQPEFGEDDEQIRDENNVSKLPSIDAMMDSLHDNTTSFGDRDNIISSEPSTQAQGNRVSYTEAIEALDLVRRYMEQTEFPSQSFTHVGRLEGTLMQQRFSSGDKAAL